MEISNMQPRKKIAYIITLPDLGGAQSHLYEVMVNIMDYGYEPILITGRDGWLTDKLKEKGIPCHIVPNLVREISLIHDFKVVKDIKNIIRHECPALVHCHSSKAGIVGRIAAHCCHIPVVFTAHGWAFTEGVSPLKRTLYTWIENMAGYWTDKIICVSDYDRNLGIKRLPKHKDKMITIHNCIPDIPELVRDFQQYPVGEVIHIIVVARFSPQKKTMQILHLLRKMLDAEMKLTVTFVGDGPQLKMAKELSKQLNLGKNVFFLGARTDVPRLLPKYDLFLLLSNWEGFPISILEAMRAGLPVIASNVGGVKEAIVNKQTGWLVDNNDSVEKYIRKICNNHNELYKVGEKSRLLYCKKFQLNNMLVKISKVYNSLWIGKK